MTPSSKRTVSIHRLVQPVTNDHTPVSYPRRRPSPRHHRPEPTPEEVARAVRVCWQHFPSIFAPRTGELRPCVAAGCDETWPCREYRHAEAVLTRAGHIPEESDRA